MSNTPNLPRTVWIVCIDVSYKNDGGLYTRTHRAFLDRDQAQQYCERQAPLSKYKWCPTACEWRTGWRRDGDTQVQYSMYINACELVKPVAQEVQQ